MVMPVPLSVLAEGIWFVARSVAKISHIKLGVEIAYEVEVKVVSRLGEIPVRGVKLTVGEDDWGASDSDGRYKDGQRARRKTTSEASLEIKATYENEGEQLRKEKITVTLGEVDPDASTQRCSISYEIPKVQDVVGVSDDIDFKTETDGKGELAWTTEGDKKVLHVTLKLSTLSLKVPYISQVSSNDTLETRPSATGGVDPEATAHDVAGDGTDGQFWGWSLCYPTSITMVIHYWGQTPTRRQVMQECYDRWTGKKLSFPPFTRLDTQSTTTSAAAAPASPTEGQYWLDTSAPATTGHVMKKAAFKLDWQTLTEESPAPTSTGKKAPEKPKVGDIWKDTSQDPAVFKKAVRVFDAWAEVPEGDWRVVYYPYTKIWKYPDPETAALKTFMPADGKATYQPTSSADRPLTRVEASDGKLGADILDQYKTWLKSGWPFVLPTTASEGHMIVARGAVVNKDLEIEWLIVNDPYGNLSYKSTMTKAFVLTDSVGKGAKNKADDVELTKGVLATLGFYADEIDASCAGTDEDALVGAIKEYQRGKGQKSPSGKIDAGDSTATQLQLEMHGKDKKTGKASTKVDAYQAPEINKLFATAGASAMKGKHAYYRNKTLGYYGNLRVKGGGGCPRIEKTLTTAEIAQKLTEGA